MNMKSCLAAACLFAGAALPAQAQSNPVFSQMFDLSASTDKDFAVIEGATHVFTPCTPCEPAKGAYSNTMKNLFDYVARWAAKF